MPFDVEFENPQKLPLPELTFHSKDNGVKLAVPALSKKWVDEQRHIKYLPLDSKNMDEVFVDKWIKTTKWLNNSLEMLLEMEHHRFWSNLVFEPDYIATIVSFLQEAVPAYVSITSISTNQQIIELYSKVANNVLTILCRAITNKESDTEWMTKEQLAGILYDKFIITVPMIFDLLVIYGPDNAHIIRRMLDTILKIQPKYRNDLKEGLNFLATTFNTIQDKVNENNPDAYEDLVMYILDCAYTIYTLVTVLPDAIDICREIQLEQKVTRFYDEAIPFLHKNIKYISPELLTDLNRGRLFLIKFFRCFIDKSLQEVLQRASDKKQSAADELLNLLQVTISDPHFVADYQRLHPVTDDIDTVVQAVRKLDKMKIDFIVKAYESGIVASAPATASSSASASKSKKDIESPSASSSSRAVDRSEIDIQSVLDVLPHLTVAFVRKLLKRYDDTESAIAAVLEGNLPPDLMELDSTTDKKVNDTVEKCTEMMEKSSLDPTGKEIVNIKLKTQVVRPKAEKRFLDDKSAIKEFHARNIEHGYVDMPDEYDDEYDDSYDAMVESESKTMSILKRTGAINDAVDEIDDSEESESGDENVKGSEHRDRSRDFCENPEVARERWARNREQKFGNKRPPKPSANVVGNPKGQGQEKSTLINRQKKSENKSSRANHNRRQGAAFKRSRGMIPS